VCKHCPAGKYFVDNGFDDEKANADADIVCQFCPRGTWTNGSDGICHLCPIGHWSKEKGSVRPCNLICDDGYLCPIGSTNPRMFAVPQGNDLPLLEYSFWIGSILCFDIAAAVILFRIA